MEEMAKIPGLQRRRNGWYLRVIIPQELASLFQKKEIIRSLKTTDYKVASKRVHAVRAGIEAEFEIKRRTAKLEAEHGDILSTYGDHELNALALKWMRNVQDRERARRINPSGGPWTEERKRDYEVELHQSELAARQEVLGISDEDRHEGMTLANRFLQAEGISFRSETEHFRKLGFFFSQAIHELAQRSLLEYQGRLLSNGQATPEARPSGFVPETVVSMMDLFTEYLSDPNRTKGASTQKNYIIIKRAVDEVIGLDTPVHLVTRQQCKDIRTFLLRLPSNAIKKTKAKTLTEAIKIGNKIALPKMADTTVNMHLQKLSAVMDFAVREEYADRNPAMGLSVQEKIKSKNRRFPFDMEQLHKIFNAPLYTGCRDDGRNYNKPGTSKPRRARFWVPLISLWTGMRLNEICQLHVDDVGVLDKTNVIFIRYEEGDNDSDDEKRIKTDNGIRFVPIHPMLERIGFLKFVEDCKGKKQKRLFPELKQSARGDHSHEMTKWFGHFLESVGAKKPRTTFHSFRHLYRDAVREAELPLDAALQLGGWSRGTTDADYGSGLKASTLYKHIGNISYPDLDLSHLYQ